MAKNTTAFFIEDDRIPSPVATFANADGTTIKDICSAAADGSRLMEILITSTDTAAKDMTLYLNNGSVDIPIKLATVAARQGDIITTPDPLRLINSNNNFINGRLLDRDQNYYIPLPAGFKLRAKCNAAVTAGLQITVLAILKDF
jgi:hypothetical protein